MRSGIIVLGYDPVFLDILVSPKSSDGSSLLEMPELGEHVPNTSIRLVAGGNGLNIAKILVQLNLEVIFVAKMDGSFQELIHKEVPELKLLPVKDLEPNYTVALQFPSGEIQMNAVKHVFESTDLTSEALTLLALSDIIPFSNLGLNKEAPALYNKIAGFLTEFFQLLSIRDNKNSSSIIKEFEDLVTRFSSNFQIERINYYYDKFASFLSSITLDETLTGKIYYFDPSTLAEFSDWDWLKQFLYNVMPSLPGSKIISVNEHEHSLLEDHGILMSEVANKKNTHCIQHDISSIRIWSSSFQSPNPVVIDVPFLDPATIVTTVGAGDVFNAGLLSSYLKTMDIIAAVKSGITIAQKFLIGQL
ncbi:MAG: PfkB family carbohydrate kinase [Candidatus Hodarchaeales archaeon]|jgi:hypothetical protein